MIAIASPGSAVDAGVSIWGHAGRSADICPASNAPADAAGCRHTAVPERRWRPYGLDPLPSPEKPGNQWPFLTWARKASFEPSVANCSGAANFAYVNFSL
jgi:hypothetical protein